jgi:uncharacterized Zn-binding protein involved in type VI secretion
MPGLPMSRMGDLNIMMGVIFTGDPTVLTNGRPTACMAKSLVTVHPGPKPPHPVNPLMIPPNMSVMVGGTPAGHVGSIDACLHMTITGSTDVMVGF